MVKAVPLPLKMQVVRVVQAAAAQELLPLERVLLVKVSTAVGLQIVAFLELVAVAALDK